MTIDPRWSIILSLLLGIVGFIVAIPDWANSGIDPTTVKHLVWWLGVGVGIGNIINAGLAGIPSKDNQTGFLIKGPPPKSS